MAISYTDNFAFALLDTGSSNWGAVINAMLETVDLELKAAQSPIILMSNSQILVCKRLGTVLLKHYNN